MLSSRIISSFWLVFVFIYFIFTDHLLGLILILFTLVLGLVLFLNLRFLSNKLSFDLSSEGTVHKGEAGGILVKVRNESWFPVARVQLHFVFKNSLTETEEELKSALQISSKSKETLKLDLLSEYAGAVEVKLKEVKYFDFLGIFMRQVKELEEKSKLYILPEQFPVSIDLAESRVGFSDNHQHEANRKGRDGLEIFGIKEYTVDDSLKNIHWKLTSKFDELIVKELSEAVNYTFLIILDLTSQEKKQDPAAIDALVDSFVSISKGLLDIDYAHSIAWLDQETDYLHIEEVFSEEHLTSLLRQILSVRPVQAEQSVLERFIYVNESYSHIIQLVTDRQEDLMTELDQAELKTIIQTKERKDDRINVHYVRPERKAESLSHLIL